jgi:hypothetical protein
VLRLATALVFTLAALGCARSHDLGVDTSSSGSGGATAASSSHAAGSGGAPTATTGTGGTPEPAGPTALTVVNGVNDYNAVRFCFLPGDTPWPAATAGLAFAAGQGADIATALPAGSDVTPWVVAGDLDATAGMTCTQMLALAQPVDGGTPPVVAVALGVIPQTVLASNKSLLLVANGCLGGAGHTDPKASTACGMAYSATSPTAGVVLLGMSRLVSAGGLSLQAVNASITTPTSDVRVQPSMMGTMEINLAPSLSQGAIGPYPPFDKLAASAYGVLANVQILTYPPGGSTQTSAVLLSDALATSSVDAASFVNGASLVLVAVGSGPGVQVGPFWHKLTYALVKADPG